MKKTGLLILALALILSLSACGDFVSILPGTELETPEERTAENSGEVAVGESFEARPLLAFMSRESFGESYYEDTPAALSYQPTTEDGSVGCRSYVFDRSSIIAVCDALRDMTVTGRAPEEAASTAEYILSFADGRDITFTFGLLPDGITRVLSTYTGDYTITGGDAIWETEFPAYSQNFDLFDLYFSADIRAFADEYDQTKPVSVSLRMNSGATITSTDGDTIDAVFRVLEGASVIVVENRPEQNIDLNQTRDYIFTMEDDTTYTFRFAGSCLAVTVNSGIGTVYYWMSGVDELGDIAIASENENGRFAGGEVSDLRDDILRAAKAARGVSDEELSVMGVFVEYSIGDESGYIALEGDEADNFVSLICSVAASGETVENADGDRVTVSVTLSDSSGPILYFTGDTIQQVVGINYACDSDQMQSVRDTVLSLAASGDNTAEIEEGGTE